jgi:hypothetical protein
MTPSTIWTATTVTGEEEVGGVVYVYLSFKILTSIHLAIYPFIYQFRFVHPKSRLRSIHSIQHLQTPSSGSSINFNINPLLTTAQQTPNNNKPQNPHFLYI